MKRTFLTLLLLAMATSVVLAMATSVVAQPVSIDRGDVLVVASVKYDFYDTTLQQLRLFNSNADVKALLEYDPGNPIVTDRNGNFYALQSGGTIEVENASRSAITGQIVVPEFNTVTLAVDALNDLLILGASGKVYFVINRHPVFTFQLPGIGIPVTTASMDVASDQCTLLYTDGGTGGIRRFDVCRFAPLTAIAPELRYQNVRALSDGGFVASRDGSLDFYDAGGRLILTGQYSTASPITAIAFDVDPANIWIGAGEIVTKVRIRDRQLLASTPPAASTVFRPLCITVPGETRPSAASLLGTGRTRSVRH